MRYALIILLLTWLPSLSTNAQVKISGKVVAKESREALGFSTISVKGKPVGVVANSEGEFDFNIPKEYLRDTLLVSYIGYKSFEKPLCQMSSYTNLSISLEEHVTELSEVTINSEGITGEQIIRDVIKAIPDNYPQSPYLMKGFYRDYKRQDGRYVSLFEAAVDIYDKKYDNPNAKNTLKEKVYLKEVRQSKKVELQVYKDFNFLSGLLSQNDVRYVKNALDIKGTKYEIADYTLFNDQWVYVIKTDQPWENYIYVDAESFAVLQIDLNATWDGEESKNVWFKNSLKFSATKVTKRLTFQKYNDLYYPVFMNYATTINTMKLGADEVIGETYTYQELVINSFESDVKNKPDKSDLMNKNTVLELQSKPYNKAFWEDYNIIKESPLNKDIIKDLEQQGTLDQQFEESGRNIKK